MAGNVSTWAPDGQLWVCQVCGRTSRDRYMLGDTSCVTWAILCHDPPAEGLDGQRHWLPVDPAPIVAVGQAEREARNGDPDNDGSKGRAA